MERRRRRRRRRSKVRKHTPKHNQQRDRISELADDILVSILSRLTLKEAASSSILSRRWRHLWERITNLNFDAPELFNRSCGCRVAQIIEGHRFTKWVNHVLKFHKYSTQSFEEFTVRFLLDKSFKRHIDKWLKFALSRKVQRLHLDFAAIGIAKDCYAFPFDLYTSKSTISFKSLKALCLNSVRLGDEGVSFILSNSPFLEQLTIHGNLDLLHLKLIDPSLKLKYLDLKSCFCLRSIEICNVNLVSFKYVAARPRFCIKNVPFLVEVHIGGLISGLLSDIFAMLSWCLYQIETLTLEILDNYNIKKFEVLSELSRLKQFKVKFVPRDDESLLVFASLVKAAPYLQEFVMEAELVGTPWIHHNRIIKAIKCPHRHLKKVEFSGYFGRASDLELVMFFLANAISLEKIIVTPYSPERRRQCNFDQELAARKRAKEQLLGKVPRRVELVIL